MSVQLPEPSDVDSGIMVVIDWRGVRSLIRCAPDRWSETMGVACLGWDYMRGRERVATIGRAGCDEVTIPADDGQSGPYPVLDWWPVVGVPLPESADADLLVCYAVDAVRHVERLRAYPHACGGPQWGGRSHRVDTAYPGQSHVHHDGRRHTVLGWVRIAEAGDPETIAADWRVDVAAVRRALRAKGGAS